MVILELSTNSAVASSYYYWSILTSCKKEVYNELAFAIRGACLGGERVTYREITPTLQKVSLGPEIWSIGVRLEITIVYRLDCVKGAGYGE